MPTSDPIKLPPSTPSTPSTPIKSEVTKTPEDPSKETEAKFQADKAHSEQIKKEREEFLKKSEEETMAFLQFPEVRKLTRVEYLTKVRDILNLHSSDSNSASKAYNEIESITPS